MLVNCIVIQKFWFEVIRWWKSHSGECLLIDDLSIMYGYNPEDPKMHIFKFQLWPFGPEKNNDIFHLPRDMSTTGCSTMPHIIFPVCFSHIFGD